MVNSDSDDWLKTGGDVPYELREDLIDKDVAYYEVKTQHDWDIEDADEVLASEQTKYTSNWVEGKLAASEEVAEDYEVYGQAKVVDE